MDYMAEIERDLGRRLGRRVKIDAGAQKGSITLEYYGKEDFEILCGMLNSLKENHRGN